jgi:hypothetical protein
MAEKAFGYTLWRRRPGHVLGDKAAASGSWYFDLGDKDAVTGALDVLIGQHGKGDAGREGYRLEILDPVTGEHIRDIVPLETALSGVPNGTPSLEDVSDERLMMELSRITREIARRLGKR